MKKAMFCIYSLTNFAQDKDKYVELKVNKYGFIYRSKTNIIKLVTKNKNSLKNISLKSDNSNIVKKNDIIYELTGVYDWLKVESIDVLFYNSRLKVQKKLYSLSFPVFRSKGNEGFYR